MNERVCIIGDGQMGLVLAEALAWKNIPVALWGPFPEQVEALRTSRTSDRRMPGLVLPDSVNINAVIDEAISGATLILNAVPTQFIRPVWSRFVEKVPRGVPVASVSKGIEDDTLLRPLQVVADTLGEARDLSSRPMVAFSGPTIAAELADHKPATLVAASKHMDAAQRVQDAFTTPWMRIYTSDDVIGVEVAGAVKNIIALAAGLVDGLELGYNAKSALLARGLAEIVRFGTALGAKAETFFGVAGVGDLATTCFCPEGRNRTCGEALGKGVSLEDHLKSTASVVEGVATTRSVSKLRKRLDVEMPITEAVYRILFDHMPPRDAIALLMEREPKAEQVG